MQIFVKTLTGRTVTIEVYAEDTISQVKQKYHDKEAVPIEEQRLIYGAHELQDEKLVQDYDIQKDATLHLVLRLPGG